MATSIKVGERTKDRLERLQAEIKLETGRKITQQELLDRIVARQFESKTDLIDSFADDWDGLSEEERAEWFSGTTASGGTVGEEDIDRILYDQEAPDG